MSRKIWIDYDNYNKLWRLIHKLEKLVLKGKKLSLSELDILRMKTFGTDQGLFKSSKTAKSSRQSTLRKV